MYVSYRELCMLGPQYRKHQHLNGTGMWLHRKTTMGHPNGCNQWQNSQHDFFSFEP